MINFKTKKYANGLNLITAPLNDTEAVTVLVIVGVGSRYETKEQSGISHFLEHLFFKGTKKRPSTLKLSKELDALGAKYNAFTGEEYTGFYIQSAGEKFSRSWEILSDMILNPLIPEREVERERGVILEEMNMYYDTPQAYIGELAKRTVFGNTPLGRDVIGTKEAINSISKNDVVAYRKENYKPSNMIVAIAGDKNTSNWEKAVEQVLGKGKEEKTPGFQPADVCLRGPKVEIHNKKTDQSHMIVNIPTFPITDPRWRTLEVLTNILGGQMSSRLFIEIRERRGLAYYIKAMPENFHDTGLLSISAGLRTSNVDEALEVIKKELNKMVVKPVTAEELRRAKDNIIGHLALGLEGSFNVAEFLADQLFYENKIRQPEDFVKEYQSVTQKDIQNLSREIFCPENISVTVIGPLGEKEKPKFEKIMLK